jgi:hypothetical protein
MPLLHGLPRCVSMGYVRSRHSLAGETAAPEGAATCGRATSMQQIALRLPKPILAAIDQIVSGRLDQADRSAIIRELLAEALTARANGGR